MADQLSKFEFSGHALRVIPTEDGLSFWAVIADAAKILGYRDAYNASRSVPQHHKGTHSVSTPSGPQKLLCVDEPGLYRLIFRSNKPQADPFMEWVTSEILPSIRRTGAYQRQALPAAAQTQVQNRLLKADAAVRDHMLAEVIEQRNGLQAKDAESAQHMRDLETENRSLLRKVCDLQEFKISALGGEDGRKRQGELPLGGAS